MPTRPRSRVTSRRRSRPGGRRSSASRGALSTVRRWRTRSQAVQCVTTGARPIDTPWSWANARPRSLPGRASRSGCWRMAGGSPTSTSTRRMTPSKPSWIWPASTRTTSRSTSSRTRSSSRAAGTSPLLARPPTTSRASARDCSRSIFRFLLPSMPRASRPRTNAVCCGSRSPSEPDEPPMATQPGPGAADVPIPDALPVLPLRDAVVFPLTVMPMAVDEPRSVKLVDDVMRGNRLLALVARREAGAEPAQPEDRFRVGTAVIIHQLARVPDGGVRLMVQGIERVRVLDWIGREPYLVARLEVAREDVAASPDGDAVRHAVVDVFRRLVEVSPELPDELAVAAANAGDARHLVYFVASVIPLPTAARQELLELDPVGGKLRRLLDLLQRELAVRELGRKITSETQERLTKQQREFYLREQQRSIQRELGEEESGPTEVADLRRRIEEAGLSEEARREAERELGRLASIPATSPEHGMVVTYLEWLASLPWAKLSGGSIDVGRARQVLDEDHYDLDKIKDRIVEYLAVKKLRQERALAEPPPVTGDTPAREPILCFVGPPGVGKTSLGQSIARALGRKFVRMSLGGVRDEAEIRGHRRTYIGSLPGRVIQGLRRDRMEVLTLSGYTDEEKLGIALQYLVPKQLAANGLVAGELVFEPDAIRLIVRRYTREAGVRNLDREIAAVARKVARRLAEGERGPFQVTASNVGDYLGRSEER